MQEERIGPALFFHVPGRILLYSCPLSRGEPYGDFIVYPLSHMDVWEKHYAKTYDVDFDYYPRGRIVYRKSDDTFLIYYDRCMEPVIRAVAEKYAGEKIILGYDEHYQCHRCNKEYVV